MKALWTLLLIVVLASAAAPQPQPPNVEWSPTCGRYRYDLCFATKSTPDRGYLLARAREGMPLARGRLAKTDADGDSLWSRAYGGENSDDECYDVMETEDGGYVLIGQTRQSSDGQGWLVKTGPELLAGETPVAGSPCPLSNYPNPFNPTTILNFALPRTSWVTIRAYDILGPEVELTVNTV